jgi:hypothetical protein
LIFDFYIPSPLDLEYLVEGRRCLKEIIFLADYLPPISAELHEIKRTPEEMEREAKRQEEELQKLVLIEMKYVCIICTYRIMRMSGFP